jgi:hypothetical protein
MIDDLSMRETRLSRRRRKRSSSLAVSFAIGFALLALLAVPVNSRRPARTAPAGGPTTAPILSPRELTGGRDRRSPLEIGNDGAPRRRLVPAERRACAPIIDGAAGPVFFAATPVRTDANTDDETLPRADRTIDRP